MTLEDYFKYEYGGGKIDHTLRASVYNGVVEIYIHPSGKNGNTTPSLLVEGNTVRLKPGSWSPEWPSVVCNKYTRPTGVMGGPCLLCGKSQPEHVPVCLCGADRTDLNGLRLDILCPKHDGDAT
jgi:hypothetical protein